MSKLREFEETGVSNNASYRFYYFRLLEIALSRFNWLNLPPTCDSRTLELSLFKYGKCLFFADEFIGELTLPFEFGGNFDVYGVPVIRRAYSNYNNYHIQRNNTNSVVIYNNLLRLPSFGQIVKFAKDLYLVDRITSINVNAQKTPIIVQATENQRLTMLNLYRKYDGNVPFIFGTENLDFNGLKALSTNAPFLADKLQDLKEKIWNEALTYLGISNIAVNKKERLIVDEVARAQGGVFASRNSYIESREEACKKINAMFGTNIEVEFREYNDMTNELPNISKEGEFYNE